MKKKHIRTQPCKTCQNPLRPCLADDKPALFHRWIDEDRVLVKLNGLCSHETRKKILDEFQVRGVLGPEGSTEVVHNTLALVEYHDGSVGKVRPELITFLDKEVIKA